MYEKLKDFQITIVAVIVGLALLICTGIIGNAITKEGITVTGSAYKIVKSDTGILRLEIKTRKTVKADGFALIKKQLPQVKDYLVQEGIKPEEITYLTPDCYPINKYDPKSGYNTNEIEGYNISQVVQIKTTDVDKIAALSTGAQSLLDKGIDINLNAPEYYYSKLGEIKVELLKEASEDAKQRAKGMLSATGNNVGKIQSVKMGVFQITPPDSTEVTDSGMSDTSSIEKKVTAVANVTFSIK